MWGCAAVVVIALVGGVSCARLPVLVPDLARRPTQAVPLEGAQGPLDTGQRRAIVARLAEGSQPTDIFAYHLAIEEALVGSPLTTGNAVTLLQDGPSTYQAMWAAIVAAREHIHLETYILDDDEVGQRFADALLERQGAGARVLLLPDSVGTMGTPAASFERLSDAGVQVLEFNPVNPLLARGRWELNRRDHRKLLIVDGRIAFLGGINFSSVYSGGSFSQSSRLRPGGGPAWRDTDLRLEGPVVAQRQRLFLAAWDAQGGPTADTRVPFPPPVAAGRQVVRAIGSSPNERFSLIYATLLSAIGNALTSVQLTNAYFAPDPQLLAALEAAAGRGVAVTLILPSRTDSWLVFHAGRASYERLLRAGVRIFERGGVLLHSKTALVDGVWATVGSTNLDWRSFLHNHKLSAVVLGTEFGAQLQAMFDADLAGSDEITLARWQRRPLSWRAQEAFARLWEYWL